jgi:EmrB/QacA subfamily drug resistance transporter
MAQNVTYGSRAGRWVLLATILASGISQLDATVVNVALPRIGKNLHIGLTSLQWTVNAYALTLSGLLLLGGSLGDRFGRRRIFVLGVIWFTAASLGCALAPSGAFLIAMRAFQGVGGAMLTPGSLAILQAVFEPDDRAPAVGAWSGLTGVASALGPVVGGLLVAVAPWGWRLVFLINLPLAAVVVFAARHIPETRDESAEGRIDIVGAALAAVGLAAVIYGLTEGSTFGWGTRQLGATAAGVALLAIFTVVELREPTPMLPMRLFRSQQFSAANAVTIVVYGSLGGIFFLLPVELQQGAGFTPLAAGASLLPVTAMLLLLSSRMGRYAAKRGPRLQMTVGPIVAAVGVTLLARVHPGASYVSAVLPGILVFGLGMAITVAPLTATVMAAAPPRDVGVASAVNNDVARTAALFAVAVLPALSGITAAAYKSPTALSNGFHHAVWIAATLCALGGVLAGLLIRNDVLKSGTAKGEAADQVGVASRPGSSDAASPDAASS